MNWKRLGRYLIAAFATTCGWAGAWGLRFPIEDALFPNYFLVGHRDSGFQIILESVIGFLSPEIVAHGLVWFIGGLSIGIGLRSINRGFTWRNVLLLAFAWMVGGYIWIYVLSGPLVRSPSGRESRLWMGYLHGTLAAALLTGLMVHLSQPLAPSWQLVAITLGWSGARLLVGINYFEWGFSTNLITHLVRGTVMGMMGSIIMYTTLYLTKWDQAEARPSINPITVLLRDQPISAQILKRTQRSTAYPVFIIVGAVAATMGMWFLMFVHSFVLRQWTALTWSFMKQPLSAVLIVILAVTVLIGVIAASFTYERIGEGKQHLLSLTGVTTSIFILSMIRAAFRHNAAWFIGLACFAYFSGLPAVFILIGSWSDSADMIWSLMGASYLTLGALALGALALIIGVVVTWISRSQKVGLTLTPLITVLIGGALIAQALNVMLDRYWLQQAVAPLIMLLLIPYLLSSVILTRLVARDEALVPNT